MGEPSSPTASTVNFETHTALCPKHGRVSQVRFIYDEEMLGEYCFLCYHDFIKANVTPVTPA